MKRQQRFNNTRGMSLVEVMAAIAISMASVSVFLYLTLSNRNHKSQVDHSTLLKEILTNNVIELKGLQYADLPPLGKCLYRTYNFQGTFLTETQVNGTSEMCGIAGPQENEIQIIWQTMNAGSADATFSTSNLKLPVYSDYLRKVVLHVRAINKGNGQNLHSQMTIFKR
ncbi:type IV pilus modification PilV family protein [Bdellovibrio sp. HCB-110]|uniref:type IV pilus modification PilV family protein n=1 Tax=Bdellovibrio sp. HCB-110 TaxID=3391182 RepID=UPI0039B4404F